MRRLIIFLVLIGALRADFNKNIITDYGATCNGTADDSTPFHNFKVDAVAWQVIHPSDNVMLTIPYAAITGASNTSPIVIQAVNSFSNGQTVTITGVRGNTAANNTASNTGWVISSVSGTQFTLNGSVGNGAWTSGGGASRYKCVPGNTFFDGVVNTVVLDGYGAWLEDGSLGFGFQLGQFSAVSEDNLHDARIATVSAGATSVTLVDASKASLFTVGQWALVTGIDLQGFGVPMNPGFWDFVLVSNISGGTITFTTTPLTNAYKSTWPVYNDGSLGGLDLGGPGTIYAIQAKWNSTLDFRGIVINQPYQTYAVAKTVIWRDIIIPTTGDAGVLPAFATDWSLLNSSTAYNMEVDKVIDNVTIDQTTGSGIIFFQSSSVKQFNLTNSSFVQGIIGTPLNFVGSNSTIGPFHIGASTYGRTLSSRCTTCVLGAISSSAIIDRGGPNAIGFNNYYTMSGGCIISANANGPVAWAIPGAHLIFGGDYPTEGSPIVITNITQDATNTNICTNLSGGFPTIPDTSGMDMKLTVVSAPLWYCTCTGSADAVDFSQAGAQGRPLFSYSKRTYSNNIGQADAVPILGNITSASFNVTTAYTGVQSTLDLNGMFVFGRAVIKPNGTAANYNPIINLKTAGNRIVTQSGVTGTQTGDSALALPATCGACWLANNMLPTLSTDIGGESGVGPTITIEVITDQGLSGGSALSGKVAIGGKTVIQ